MTILLLKGLTRNPEIGNISDWVLTHIWRVAQVREEWIRRNDSDEMLLNAVKCQGYSFYRFWVINGKPTGEKVKVLRLPPPRLGSNLYFLSLFCKFLILPWNQNVNIVAKTSVLLNYMKCCNSNQAFPFYAPRNASIHMCSHYYYRQFHHSFQHSDSFHISLNECTLMYLKLIWR